MSSLQREKTIPLLLLIAGSRTHKEIGDMIPRSVNCEIRTAMFCFFCHDYIQTENVQVYNVKSVRDWDDSGLVTLKCMCVLHRSDRVKFLKIAKERKLSRITDNESDDADDELDLC